MDDLNDSTQRAVYKRELYLHGRSFRLKYMRQFGLIGFPLGHSFSKPYFAEKFDREGLSNCSYDNFPIDDIAMLSSVLSENKDLVGLNVTIPYKEEVLAFCDALSEEAAHIGAVNTLQIKEDGSIKGHNTDIPGFGQSLQHFIPDLDDVKALILGSGGSSKAVRFALDRLGIKHLTVSRTPDENQLSYQDLDAAMLQTHRLVINTTPLGMSPHIDLYPAIPYDLLTVNHHLFDLIYNPAQTRFLQKGEKRGASTKNGQEMLILQAEASWEIWNTTNG